jgi:hypothetical protein
MAESLYWQFTLDRKLDVREMYAIVQAIPLIQRILWPNMLGFLRTGVGLIGHRACIGPLDPAAKVEFMTDIARKVPGII